jgi:transcriptional regulator with GAF, ATPase, and Fis domain
VRDEENLIECSETELGTTMASTAPAAAFNGTRNKIMVASADPLFRKRMKEQAERAWSFSEEAVGGAQALARLGQTACDAVMLDRNLPDLDATEVAEMIHKLYPRMEVEIVDSRISGEEDRPSATLERVEDGRAAQKQRVVTTCEEVACASGKEELPLPRMIGTSAAMQNVYRLARMVAKRDTTVLITGETGTGKELVAQAIHDLSPRARHPFVVVNCAAIPEALLEAELFGHARGAFTGAVQSRLGRIHVAQGGTLFLDEIGEMPLSMQAKLLRFLQNGEVQRLGSSDVYRVDVRVVCATNVCLEEMVDAKQCRRDLYYRLAIFPIVMPPLRVRTEDIAALAQDFLEKLSAESALPRKEFAGDVLGLLQRRTWTGNVRELQHALERAFILSGNATQLRQEHFASAQDGR